MMLEQPTGGIVGITYEQERWRVIAGAPAGDNWFQELVELVKHVFIGVALFFVLAIPAIFLDLMNQGVQLVAVEVAAGTSHADTVAVGGDGSAPQRVAGAGLRLQAKTVSVSGPVRQVLTLFEWLLLLVDTFGTGAYVLSHLVKYLRNLRWR